MSRNMTSFEEVQAQSSEEEAKNSSSHRSRVVKIALLLTVGIAASVFLLGSTKSCKPQRFGNLFALQGKSAVDVEANIAMKASSLKRIKNRSLADAVVLKAMKSAGQEKAKQYSEREVRELPANPADAARDMLSYDEVKAYKAGKKQDRLTDGRTAFCAFNVLEAFVSAVGLGDDINAIIRVCPPPRDGESELACQVDGAILVAWVGNLAAKLSFAASNCADTISVNALCGVGVTGLVSVMGELAATASLAAATCTPTPPSLTTTKISVLGDQTVRERRLLIGEGTVGNGVQCAVDVGMVAANIANMGISIFQAVESGNCGRLSLQSPINKLTGIPEALCTVDIGGAVAYISQVVTFINLIVVHCQDFLDVSALCGASIAGITTSAAAIAPYGAAVHAACAKNLIARSPEIQAKINSLYTVPQVHPRRLQELEDAVSNLKSIRQKLEQHLGINATASSTAISRADLANMVQLIDGGMDEDKASLRGSSTVDECEE
ncbi:yvaG [Symbiodinium sp. CCMP2592]|nr:yvaG [Symbiodinium sp. CCMP2592]